jgi:rSAM/selenodomain-associated transferase 1
VTLIIIAKAPVPGRVKTRLCPPCTPGQAAALAAAALADTVECARRAGDRVVVALDGAAPPWLDVEVIAQRGEGLAERLAAAFEDVGEPALLIGMDTPQVTPALLEDGLARLRAGAPAVLGRASDGGYWALGLQRPDRELFRAIPMSTERTAAEQARRLAERDLAVSELPVLRDVDTFADARCVAAAAPHTRFAATLRAIAAAPLVPAALDGIAA